MIVFIFFNLDPSGPNLEMQDFSCISSQSPLPRLDRQTSTYGALTKTFNNNNNSEQVPWGKVKKNFEGRVLQYVKPFRGPNRPDQTFEPKSSTRLTKITYEYKLEWLFHNV